MNTPVCFGPHEYSCMSWSPQIQLYVLAPWILEDVLAPMNTPVCFGHNEYNTSVSFGPCDGLKNTLLSIGIMNTPVNSGPHKYSSLGLHKYLCQFWASWILSKFWPPRMLQSGFNQQILTVIWLKLWWSGKSGHPLFCSEKTTFHKEAKEACSPKTWDKELPQLNITTYYTLCCLPVWVWVFFAQTRILVAKSYAVPQRPSRFKDSWRWWWWWARLDKAETQSKLCYWDSYKLNNLMPLNLVAGVGVGVVTMKDLFDNNKKKKK